ncbi:extracellular solute-binding protein [Demequina sp. NBRC 110057]|uniref:extracellular solute-binding protein n=1 Tax=Demequina sp. NBRC 110057 TaxID=1570346 RepID=UPI0009FD4651|nr:extracellular solute-binding protein [Demequina sp. NBRC 110057]
MKKMTQGAVAMAAASAIVLAGCSSSGSDDDATTEATDSAAPTTEETSAAEDITLWLMGEQDTPEALVDYLKETYTEENGGTLTVERIGWGDAISSLTTALPDSANTPDVAEVGNTQSSTFTTVGAYLDITDMYEELGGDSLLPGFVEAGKVGESNFTLPYYFGSRLTWYRKDLYEQAGVEVPTTLADITTVNAKMKDEGIAGFYMGGRDWRNGVSWIFANGGDLATYDGSAWAGSLSSPEAIEGMEQWQELFTTASVAQSTDTDEIYQAINDDMLSGTPAATEMAPSWAACCLGDVNDDDTFTWNDEKFGYFALPGVDGDFAPVFAGGSNIGISAASQHVEGAKDLMRIIFSEDYQLMLSENGLGPANLDYTDAYVELAPQNQAALDAASNSKLTPAAPGWAAIEEAQILEDYFQAVSEGGDVTKLAAEYDSKINELING